MSEFFQYTYFKNGGLKNQIVQVYRFLAQSFFNNTRNSLEVLI